MYVFNCTLTSSVSLIGGEVGECSEPLYSLPFFGQPVSSGYVLTSMSRLTLTLGAVTPLLQPGPLTCRPHSASNGFPQSPL